MTHIGIYIACTILLHPGILPVVMREYIAYIRVPNEEFGDISVLKKNLAG